MKPPDPPPRSMPLRALGWGTKFLLLFGGIWMAVGVLLTTIFLLIGRPFWVDQALDKRGISAQAESIGVRPTSASVNRQPVYEIVVEFQGSTGRHTAVLPTHDHGVIRAAKAKQPLSIEYDPEDPTIVRIQGSSASIFGMLALLPAPFGIIGGGLFAFAILLALRQRRTYVNGTAIQAEVTAVKRTASRQNMRPVMRAHFRYQVLGEAYEGNVQRVDPPAEGESIWVFYDPDRPEKCIAA